jgi:hypothetical protein
MVDSKPSGNAKYLGNAQLSAVSCPKITHSIPRRPNFSLERYGCDEVIFSGYTMKLQMDKTLNFWIDVAYQDLKDDHANLTKRQLVAHILREYESRGDAMRHLNATGKIAWKATPSFLNRIADAERDAQDEPDDD